MGNCTVNTVCLSSVTLVIFCINVHRKKGHCEDHFYDKAWVPMKMFPEKIKFVSFSTIFLSAVCGVDSQTLK